MVIINVYQNGKSSSKFRCGIFLPIFANCAFPGFYLPFLLLDHLHHLGKFFLQLAFLCLSVDLSLRELKHFYLLFDFPSNLQQVFHHNCVIVTLDF